MAPHDPEEARGPEPGCFVTCQAGREGLGAGVEVDDDDFSPAFALYDVDDEDADDDDDVAALGEGVRGLTVFGDCFFASSSFFHAFFDMCWTNWSPFDLSKLSHES